MKEIIIQIRDLCNKYKKFSRIVFILIFIVAWISTINKMTDVMSGKSSVSHKTASNYDRPDGTLALANKNYAEDISKCKKGPICFVKNYFKVQKMGKDGNHDFNEISHQLNQYE